MTKFLSILFLFSGTLCQAQKSMLRDNIFIKLYPYTDNNVTKAAAMPEIKPESAWMKYEKRFYYLLMNVPAIHLPEKAAERDQINSLYPDTSKIKALYLEKYAHDKKLPAYIEETVRHIDHPDAKISKAYTVDELMEVASRFFYCDQVLPDTNVQAHVCVGLNGIKEAHWQKDYTLLEAFCYEAIFKNFDNENSNIWETFGNNKNKSCQQFRPNITTMDTYLEQVKTDLFARMKNDDILKQELLKYYAANKNNLAFTINV